MPRSTARYGHDLNRHLWLCETLMCLAFTREAFLACHGC